VKRLPGGILKKISMIVLDVDGVLTDGGIIIGSDGTEFKKFDVKDGTGISIGRHAGIKFAVISGRFSEVITRRSSELKMDAVYQDVAQKLDAYEDLKKKFGLKDENICFIGDEIVDIPVLEKCGLGAAPFDAVPEAKKSADYVCEKKGGHGCVREVIEMIVKNQGLWEKAVNRYLGNEKHV
jgi:3-deoxy-D-manno-octulosonate 8-phosphate phosphatase (KDO 8-P phosphatase)